MSKARAVVGILPGHLVGDETHVINHFHHHLDGIIKGLFGEVRVVSIETLRRLFNRYGYPHVVIAPDSHSYSAPWDLDWLLIASKAPINRAVIYRHVAWAWAAAALGTAWRAAKRRLKVKY